MLTRPGCCPHINTGVSLISFVMFRSRWLEAFEGTDDDVDLKQFLKRVSSGSEEHRKKVKFVMF